MARRLGSERHDAGALRSSVVSLSDYESLSRAQAPRSARSDVPDHSRSNDNADEPEGPHSSAFASSPAPRTRDVFRVLAVLDGTRESSRLLDYLLDLKKGMGDMDVVMIHCYEPAFWTQIGPLGGGHRNRLGEMTKRSRQFASRRLAAAQVKQSHRMILGDPTDLILKCLVEQTFDLILLAGRDQNPGWARALNRLGLAVDALPSRVMRRTAVPVCVIR